MALVRNFIEEHEDGVKFYSIESDTEGMGVLQIETGILYGGVAVTDNDPYTYEEAPIPNYAPTPNLEIEEDE